MATLEKHAKLVEALLRRTKKGDIDWKTTVREDAFQVSFKDNSVVISPEPSRESDEPDYKVTLVNSDGAVADEFKDTDLERDIGTRAGSNWYSKLRDLHDLARRAALGTDKLLNDILKEIDDDIPF